MTLLTVLFQTPPTLSADQFSFQGLTLGAATPFGFTKLEGLDKPDVRSGDTARARARGRQPGLNLLDERTITATLDIGQVASQGNFGGYGSLPGALAALRTAASTEGTSEFPLWVQMPGLPFVVGGGRITKKNVPWDIAADRGGIVQGASIQWVMADPYFYGVPVAQTVGLPGPSAGTSFPLGFPLTFGASSTPNQLLAVNAGDVTCYPVLVMTGPCVNPSVQNLSVAGNPTLTFGVSMAAGDQMMVDCDSGAVTYTAAGSIVSSPLPQVLSPGSTFFGIPPGSPSVISFNSQDTTAVAGSLTVYSAMALDALL
jgi:hypothetical protein